MYEKNFIKIINTKISYIYRFDENNKNTIVILHGWGGSSKSWISVGELLFNTGFNVIVPDLPGFGETQLNKIYDIDEYAKIIENFIKEIGIDNIILWGHSNGGAISIKIANNKQINISRLILNNSAGIRNDKKRSIKRKIFNTLSSLFKSTLSMLPIFIKNKFQNCFFKKARILFYKLIGGHDYINAENNPILKQTYLNVINSDLSKEIKEIQQNTLLIRGRDDTYTPLSDGFFMRNNIKNSKLIILDDEKHGIHLKSPEKLVNTFLTNI